MTPKVGYIHNEMKRWIKKFGKSLLYITEQAFEAVHYDFLSTEKLYKIPRTGEELLAGERRFSSDPSFGRKTKGTKAQQATKKRNTKSSEGTPPRESNQSDRPPRGAAKKAKYVGEPKLARKLLVQAVAAYNAKIILRCGEGCYERMVEILE